jgi:uncharacterized protein
MKSVPLVFPEKILDQHLVVLGKTGAGKSSALRHVVEHLLARRKRVCVVDPKGDWWGLKVSADGRGGGFPVILFGDFKNEKAGDIPLTDRGGAHVAELVASGNRPAAVGMRGWTQGQMHRFWIDFASTLFAHNQGEFYLVADEVHNFAPKGKILSPQVGEALHWSNRLLSEGRGLGLVCLIASQRPQKVHNDTLTSCETLVAMRVVHKADRDAVEDWIKGAGDTALGREVLNSLAGMPRGDAFVWSPEAEFGPERLSFPMFTTFDSFAPPQLQKKVSEQGWAGVDLTEVRAKLAAVIEEAEQNDPKKLQERIARGARQLREQEREIERLNRELEKERSKPGAGAAAAPALRPAELKRAEALVEKFSKAAAQIDATLASAREKLAEQFDRLSGVRGDLLAEGEQIRQALARATRQSAPAAPPAKPVESLQDVRARHGVPPSIRKEVATPRAPSQIERKAQENDGAVSGVAQKILDTLAEFEAMGVNKVPKVQAAFLAGYSNLTSKSFANAMGSLRSGGYISYPDSDSVAFTDAGRHLAAPVGAPLSTKDMQDRISALLGGVHRRIVDQLIPAYPGAVEKSALAEACGYSNVTSKSFANALGRLRTLGFIDYPQAGQVAASKLLFPEGLS